MEPLEAIENLARIAREEDAPLTDINVRRLLRSVRPEPTLKIAPLAWSAAISAIAAGVMLTFALHTSSATTTTNSVDSISPLFNAAQVQMP
jgi:hypothetical protein